MEEEVAGYLLNDLSGWAWFYSLSSPERGWQPLTDMCPTPPLIGGYGVFSESDLAAIPVGIPRPY